VTQPPPFKMLVSFHYFRRMNMAEWLRRTIAGRPLMLFADSGAFSAKYQGVPITLEDYCAWLKAWQHLFYVYPALDVIGSAEATWRNHQAMEDQGLRPIPVFHGGEPWRYLERYIEAGHKYIALGGMVGANDAATLRWIVQCFKLAEPEKVRFHGFGQTTDSLIRPLPWYSIDSSSWSAGGRYGTVHAWEPGRQRLVNIRASSKPPRTAREVAQGAAPNARLLRAHGIDPATLSDRSRYHYSWSTWPSAVAWRRLESYLADRHHVASPDGKAPDGTHLFLAFTGDALATIALAAYDWEPTPRWRPKDLVGQPFRPAPDLRPASKRAVPA
jgi:hypothetical protein